MSMTSPMNAIYPMRQKWIYYRINAISLWFWYEDWPWASYQIRKIADCACAGNAGNVFPRHRLQRKPLVSDPGMHHGTCVTHVPWCMSGSLTCGGGENIPGIPGPCALAILRIWQEAHGRTALFKRVTVNTNGLHCSLVGHADIIVQLRLPN